MLKEIFYLSEFIASPYQAFVQLFEDQKQSFQAVQTHSSLSTNIQQGQIGFPLQMQPTWKVPFQTSNS